MLLRAGNGGNGAIMIFQSGHFGIKKIVYESHFCTLLIRILVLVQEHRAGHVPKSEVTYKTFV